MRWTTRGVIFLLGIITLLSGSCAPGTFKTVPALGPEPGDALFMEAETALQRGAYAKAMTLYDQYLMRFPEGRQVPAVLFKIGFILTERKDFASARRYYERLLSDFPDSDWREKARLGILSVLYHQAQYDQVFRYADQLNDRILSDAGLVKKYSIVGDSYLARSQPLDAAYVFMSAMRKVGRAAQTKILVKLDQVTREVSPDDLQVLLSDIDDNRYRGLLTCRLGEKYMDRGDYDRALAVISNYIAALPGNELGNQYAQRARKLIVTIDQQASYDHYAIGCLLPLTGKYKVFGEMALQGMQLALQQVAANYTEPVVSAVKLIVRDTGSDPQQAVQAVRELAEKNVAAIVGPMGPFEAAVLEAQKYHIPIIAMTNKPNFPQVGTYVFRNFLTPQMQARTLARYACDSLGLTRFAILYPDEAYGQVFAHIFWDEILAQGGIVVGFEGYNPKGTDFAAPIKRLVGRFYEVPEELKEKREQRLVALGLKVPEEETISDADESETQDSVDPSIDQPTDESAEAESQAEKKKEEDSAIVDFEALFIPDGPSNVGLILPQLAYHDIVDIQLLGTNLWYSPELVRVAKIYANGSVMPTGFWEKSPSDDVVAFSRQYEALFGETPGFIAAVAYNSTNILLSVLSSGDLSYRSQIRDGLHASEGFTGITGHTVFDESGEAQKILPLLQIDARRFIHVPAQKMVQKPSPLSSLDVNHQGAHGE